MRAFTEIRGPDRAPSATDSRLRSSCRASIIPWLDVGELLNLAAGWAPDDAGADPRRFPGRLCFPADVPFGAKASYSLAVIPLFAGRVVAGDPLRARCGPVC